MPPGLCYSQRGFHSRVLDRGSRNRTPDPSWLGCKSTVIPHRQLCLILTPVSDRPLKSSAEGRSGCGCWSPCASDSTSAALLVSGSDQRRSPILLGSGPYGIFERWTLRNFRKMGPPSLAAIVFLLGLWMLRVGVQVETEKKWRTPLEGTQVEGARRWRY